MESLQQFGQPFNCTIGKRFTCFRSSFLSFEFYYKENTTAARFMTDSKTHFALRRRLCVSMRMSFVISRDFVAVVLLFRMVLWIWFVGRDDPRNETKHNESRFKIQHRETGSIEITNRKSSEGTAVHRGSLER